MSPTYDYSFTVSRPRGRIAQRGSDGNYWRAGTVATPWGIVAVSSGVLTREGCSILGFVHNGRHHTRRFDKDYSNRYLATLANRFAKEIAS